MVDLHTHILPGLDDGAVDLDMSVQMLRKQLEQGVQTVALTSHFYRKQERPEEFLSRRDAAMEQLTAAMEGQECPQLILGAEVAWAPGMADWPELDQLCYADSRVLLVELPFTPWHEDMFRQLGSLEGRRGIIPMIAHVDRYLKNQEKKKIGWLLDLGLPMQVSASRINQRIGRNAILELLYIPDCVPISDCHNLTDRPPDLGRARKVLTKKFGEGAAATLLEAGLDILYERDE